MIAMVRTDVDSSCTNVWVSNYTYDFAAGRDKKLKVKACLSCISRHFLYSLNFVFIAIA